MDLIVEPKKMKEQITDLKDKWAAENGEINWASKDAQKLFVSVFPLFFFGVVITILSLLQTP